MVQLILSLALLCAVELLGKVLSIWHSLRDGCNIWIEPEILAQFEPPERDYMISNLARWGISVVSEQDQALIQIISREGHIVQLMLQGCIPGNSLDRRHMVCFLLPAITRSLVLWSNGRIPRQGTTILASQ